MHPVPRSFFSASRAAFLPLALLTLAAVAPAQEEGEVYRRVESRLGADVPSAPSTGMLELQDPSGRRVAPAEVLDVGEEALPEPALSNAPEITVEELELERAEPVRRLEGDAPRASAADGWVSRTPVLAVVDLDTRTIDPDQVEAITDEINAEMLKRRRYSRVYETRASRRKLERFGLLPNRNDLVPPSRAEMATVLGAHYLIAGTVNRIEGVYTMQLMLYAADSNSIVESAAVRARGGVEDLLGQIPPAVDTLMSAMPYERRGEAGSRRDETRMLSGDAAQELRELRLDNDRLRRRLQQAGMPTADRTTPGVAEPLRVASAEPAPTGAALGPVQGPEYKEPDRHKRIVAAARPEASAPRETPSEPRPETPPTPTPEPTPEPEPTPAEETSAASEPTPTPAASTSAERPPTASEVLRILGGEDDGAAASPTPAPEPASTPTPTPEPEPDPEPTPTPTPDLEETLAEAMDGASDAGEPTTPEAAAAVTDAERAANLYRESQEHPRESERAIELLQQAVELDPDNTLYQTELVMKLYHAQQYAEAARLGEEFVAAGNTNSNLTLFSAAALTQLKEYDKAIALCRTILQREPENAWALYNVATNLDLKGDPAAVDAYKDYLEVAQDNPQQAYYLRRAEQRLQEMESQVAP